MWKHNIGNYLGPYTTRCIQATPAPSPAFPRFAGFFLDLSASASPFGAEGLGVQESGFGGRFRMCGIYLSMVYDLYSGDTALPLRANVPNSLVLGSFVLVLAIQVWSRCMVREYLDAQGATASSSSMCPV